MKNLSTGSYTKFRDISDGFHRPQYDNFRFCKSLEKLMMKKIIILILISASLSAAQVGYVNVGNPVYDFLERINTLGIIKNYNPFELPKTREEISKSLIELNSKKDLLSPVEKAKLQYFLKEFSFDIAGSTEGISSLSKNGFSYLQADNPKYLYFSSGKEGSFFVNFLAGGNIVLKKKDSGNFLSVFPYTFGGELKGEFGNDLGFMLRGSNGSYFGEKSLLINEPGFDYNYKFRQSDSLYGSSYFDHSEGYFTYQSKYVNFKIGRDRVNIGYGNIKTILGNISPRLDYVSANLKYKFLDFSFLHGKLLGQLTADGNGRNVTDKFFAYHRFGFDLPFDSEFGIGETVIYSRRGLDLSYLNPFVFYKSAEHANQDRDNSMLFADFRSSGLISGAAFYLQFMLDDMDFSKIGTGWYGNQTLWNAGFSFSPTLLPADFIKAQIVRVEPYFYTHRIYDNNYTNLGYPLTDNIEPNSLTYSINYEFSLRYNLDFYFGAQYTVHGQNEIDASSGAAINFGGDINLGHRTGDALNVSFLGGKITKERKALFGFRYEPLFDYVIFGSFHYIAIANESLSSKKINVYLTFSVKL